MNCVEPIIVIVRNPCPRRQGSRMDHNSLHVAVLRVHPRKVGEADDASWEAAASRLAAVQIESLSWKVGQLLLHRLLAGGLKTAALVPFLIVCVVEFRQVEGEPSPCECPV